MYYILSVEHKHNNTDNHDVFYIYYKTCECAWWIAVGFKSKSTVAIQTYGMVV